MIAEGLVVNGVRVYITARKHEECDRTATELSAIGECVAVPADLSSPDEIDRLATTIAERERELHVLVNNAGAAWTAPLGEFPVHGIDKVLAVNLRAPLLLTQAMVPMLTAAASAADPARVIMVGSIDGMRVPPLENYSYSASKAGLHMLTRHLGHTLAAEDVNVNAVAPGPFESKMMAPLLEDPDTRRLIESSNPRRRIGEPVDVVGAVIYPASRAGAYVTGSVLPVDGGTTGLDA